ncbi:SUMF1/EgtB/PvdO family nonheme iron enzyme [Nannocystis bainbridge]|uniref:SUMF1/EgtB/PvdO family nonheme iron enzyme n=1 Tax=Nannocystis bainbridge TaxID=2995303 RepID=A0ABT5DSU3_9BACT|nr:SUMF1/EgtB/PvdO family nonheme iron enzyme [Nannocystis bainbridge]
MAFGGSTQPHIAHGPAGGCRAKPSGRRPRAAPTPASTRGATTRRARPTPTSATRAALRPGRSSRPSRGTTGTRDSRRSAYPAGASPYGALDMIGNLAEHVHDWVEEDRLANIRGYSPSVQRNPTGAPLGRKRAIRGVDYYLPMLGWERVSARNAGEPTSSDFKYGIRCARSAR